MGNGKEQTPPDLGISVAEGVGVKESGGAGIEIESDPTILVQWVDQALNESLYTVILVYIFRNHPNADVNLTREILDGRIKDKFTRDGQG